MSYDDLKNFNVPFKDALISFISLFGLGALVIGVRLFVRFRKKGA